MYPNKLYCCDDKEKIFEFVRHYPFSMIFPGGNSSFCLLPLILDNAKKTDEYLFGHIDNQNPFLQHLDRASVRAIFQGPNSYISPTDYISNQLPTWNYSMAQIVGLSSLLSDEDQKILYMKKMVDYLEKNKINKYTLDETDNNRIKFLIKEITFFRIEIKEATAIFKYSQDKQYDDMVSAKNNLLNKIHDRDISFLSNLIVT